MYIHTETEKLIVTVLNETREIDGIMTRVVEEREWRNGKLKEISLNFFAICADTKDVFYFGEDVDKTYIPARKGEYDMTLCDFSKASKLLGYNPQLNLSDYIKSIL